MVMIIKTLLDNITELYNRHNVLFWSSPSEHINDAGEIIITMAVIYVHRK